MAQSELPHLDLSCQQSSIFISAILPEMSETQQTQNLIIHISGYLQKIDCLNILWSDTISKLILNSLYALVHATQQIAKH